MNVMVSWMQGSGYANDEPFVMIDWMSGRLRPLYCLDISYNAESGEGVNLAAGGNVFNPTMLDLVLSPQQKMACEHAMAFAPEVSRGSGSGRDGSGGSRRGSSICSRGGSDRHSVSSSSAIMHSDRFAPLTTDKFGVAHTALHSCYCTYGYIHLCICVKF